MTNTKCFHVRPKKFPPGPTNVPLVGSLLNVDVRNLSKSLSKLSKKYGDVYSLFVGRTPVVCLNSFETIKKCFEKNEFSGKNQPLYLLNSDYLLQDVRGTSQGHFSRKARLEYLPRRESIGSLRGSF